MDFAPANWWILHQPIGGSCTSWTTNGIPVDQRFDAAHVGGGGGRNDVRRPSPPTNPHDRFFNYAFGQSQHAAGLLRASLPEGLAERLDWGSLERRPTNFIDARLRRLYGDLLFSARTTDSHEDTFLYALTEHQSRPHALMAYRVLRYMVGVWDEHLRVSPGIATIPFMRRIARSIRG